MGAVVLWFIKSFVFISYDHIRMSVLNIYLFLFSFSRYLEKDLTACVQDSTYCNTYKLPRTYNAYHLNGKQITIDGRLDDVAWQEVPWSENFVDMRSELYPVPYLDTKIKIRYIFHQETHFSILLKSISYLYRSDRIVGPITVQYRFK